MSISPTKARKPISSSAAKKQADGQGNTNEKAKSKLVGATKSDLKSSKSNLTGG